MDVLLWTSGWTGAAAPRRPGEPPCPSPRAKQELGWRATLRGPSLAQRHPACGHDAG